MAEGGSSPTPALVPCLGALPLPPPHALKSMTKDAHSEVCPDHCPPSPPPSALGPLPPQLLPGSLFQGCPQTFPPRSCHSCFKSFLVFPSRTQGFGGLAATPLPLPRGQGRIRAWEAAPVSLIRNFPDPERTGAAADSTGLNSCSSLPLSFPPLQVPGFFFSHLLGPKPNLIADSSGSSLSLSLGGKVAQGHITGQGLG